MNFAFFQQRRQILSLDELHGDEAESFGDAEIEDADHVAMRDFSRQDQFLLKALQNAGMAGQFRTDHLERHQPVQLAVSGLVDRAHAAFAQHLQDLVTIREDASNFEGDACASSRRSAPSAAAEPN